MLSCEPLLFAIGRQGPQFGSFHSSNLLLGVSRISTRVLQMGRCRLIVSSANRRAPKGNTGGEDLRPVADLLHAVALYQMCRQRTHEVPKVCRVFRGATATCCTIATREAK